MELGVGLVLIVAGSVLGLTTVLGLWRRLPLVPALGLIAAAGSLAGTGGLLIQEGVGLGDWTLTLAVLGGLTPLHARLLFGPPGRAR